MKAILLKEMPDWGNGEACLVRVGDRHFIVSSIEKSVMNPSPETLAFPCDSTGNNVNYRDVAGGRYASRENVIAELERYCQRKNRS